MLPISIIHASKGRPAQAGRTVKKWLSSAKDRQRIQYILSIDTSETPANKLQYADIQTDVTVCDSNRHAVDAINRGAELATGNLLVVVSDDFDCPFHWDDALLTMLEDYEDFCVKTDDGIQPWIITLPIMDRLYYERFGYIYQPEYTHMFCDTEMTHVADLLDRKLVLPVRFPHLHYSTGRSNKDSISEKNDATWQQGEQLYLQRMKENFGLIDFPGALQADGGHLQWLRSKGVAI